MTHGPRPDGWLLWYGVVPLLLLAIAVSVTWTIGRFGIAFGIAIGFALGYCPIMIVSAARGRPPG